MNKLSIFAVPEAHRDELKTDLKKTRQALAAIRQPRFSQDVKGLDVWSDLKKQAAEVKLKLRERDLLQSIKVLERIELRRGGAEAVNDAESFALEAIISYKYRPALVFQKNHTLGSNQIDDLGLMEDGIRSWRMLIGFLNAAPAVSGRHISSVGTGVARIQHASGAVVGTAWAFGKRRLLSNRHVFCDSGWYFQEPVDQGIKWTPVDGRKGVLNFLAVLGMESVSPQGFEVDDIVPNPGADASYIVTDSDAPFVLEPVLDKAEIAGTGNNDDPLKGRLVAVVGHPANADGNPADEFDHVFGGAPLRLKRFMPGRLNDQKPLGQYPANRNHGIPVLMHDCSTLKGASGSCVIDLGPANLDPAALIAGSQTLPLTFGKVIGLHFGGLWGQSNYAVPTWELAKGLSKPAF